MYPSNKPSVKIGDKGFTIQHKTVKLYLMRSTEDSRKYRVTASKFSDYHNRHELIPFSTQEKEDLMKLNLADSDLALDALIDKIMTYVNMDEEDANKLRDCIQRTVNPTHPKPTGAPFHPADTAQSKQADRDYFRELLYSHTKK